MRIIDASDSAFRAAVEVGAFRGAVANLPQQQYHSLTKYWSSTQLKVIAKQSPAHFREAYFGKQKEEKEQTTAMVDGSLFHGQTLENQNFSKNFFIMPDLNFRTNEGKARREELLNLNPGKTPVNHDQLISANAMVSSCMQHKTAGDLLTGSTNELSLFWNCPFTGLNFRAKIDAIKDNKLIELKSAKSAKPEEFARQVFALGYDLSLLHYIEGYKRVFDKTLEPRFIVTEKEPPYVTEVYKVDEGFMTTGHAKWLDAVTKLERGITKNEWPGYGAEDEEQTLFCAPWMLKQFASEEQDGI